MQHKPLSDEELAMEQLLKPGTYPAEVMACIEKQSKKGQDMLEIKLDIYDVDSDRSMHVYDYISPHFMKFKYKRFFKSAGQESVYDKGEFDASDCVRWQVVVVVDVESKAGYPPKNKIVDYIQQEQVAVEKKVLEARAKAAESKPDDLPF